MSPAAVQDPSLHVCACACTRALLRELNFQCSLRVPLISVFGLETARPLCSADSGAVAVSPTPMPPTCMVVVARLCPVFFYLLVCSYNLQPM